MWICRQGQLGLYGYPAVRDNPSFNPIHSTLQHLVGGFYFVINLGKM